MSLAALLLFTGCATSSGTPSTGIRPTITSSTTRGMPAFSDWRLAYIGQDGNLHVVSLDGKADLMGAHLTVSGPTETGVYAAGTAPDGEHLAYGTNGVNYIDIRRNSVVMLPTYKSNSSPNPTILWASDGHALVINGFQNAAAIVQLPSGTTTQEPAQNLVANGSLLIGGIYGWLGNASLAVDYTAAEASSTPTSGRLQTPQTVAVLARMDATNGKIQPIATIRSATMSSGHFSLTPDGSEALFSNARVQDFPYTPNVQRIDIHTGQTTPLPRLASIIPALGGFNALLWLPGTHLALAATGFPENGDLHYQLIDIDHDTTMPVSLPAFPVDWSPDGKTLILASIDNTIQRDNGYGFADVGVVGSGPYTLSAVTFDANWNITQQVTLTTHAMHIPMLGFVRNP